LDEKLAMTLDKLQSVESLYSRELNDSEVAFVFLGYSSILIRSNDLSAAFDPGKSLGPHEVFAIEKLDLLFFTHNHWDHFNKGIAIQLVQQTGTRVIADPISYDNLKETVSDDSLIKGEVGSMDKTYHIDNHEVVALRGVHVGPITQYLVNMGGVRVFHGGDSGFWRHKGFSADITFVPVGTARTCSPEVAFAMTKYLHPKVSIPIHGQKQEMKKFKILMEQVLPEIEVIIPEKFKVITVSVEQYTPEHPLS
jgi:L-ascorbate metabolism protein UlaG (beta-lactamase superfamily)